MQNFPSPNVIDVAALIIVAFSTLQGFRRGLSGELARLVSVVVAFSFGLYFYRPLGSWLVEHSRLTEQRAQALAFLAMVIAAVVVMIFLRFVLKHIMKIAFEKKVDKMGGCLAGFIRSSVFVIIVFLLLNMWPHDYLNRQFGEKSVIGNIVVKYMPALREQIEGVEGQKSKIES